MYSYEIDLSRHQAEHALDESKLIFERPRQLTKASLIARNLAEGNDDDGDAPTAFPAPFTAPEALRAIRVYVVTSTDGCVYADMASFCRAEGFLGKLTANAIQGGPKK